MSKTKNKTTLDLVAFTIRLVKLESVCRDKFAGMWDQKSGQKSSDWSRSGRPVLSRSFCLIFVLHEALTTTTKVRGLDLFFFLHRRSIAFGDRLFCLCKRLKMRSVVQHVTFSEILLRNVYLNRWSVAYWVLI